MLLAAVINEWSVADRRRHALSSSPLAIDAAQLGRWDWDLANEHA